MDSFDLSFALKTIPKLLPYLRITAAVMFGFFTVLLQEVFLQEYVWIKIKQLEELVLQL